MMSKFNFFKRPLLLALYVDVSRVNTKEQQEYMNKIVDNFRSKQNSSFKIEWIAIPILNEPTRVERIY